VAQEQRQWAQAEAHYQQALALKIEFNDRYSQALTLHALGSVSIEQQEYQQAENYFHQVIERYIEFNERYWLASAYHQLGRIAEAQERSVQAREYFLKDLELSTEFDDRHHSNSNSMHSLARLYRASSDTTLPAAVAALLGITPTEVVALFAQVADESEG